MWKHRRGVEIPAITLLLVAGCLHASERDGGRRECPFTEARAPFLMVEAFGPDPSALLGVLPWTGYASPGEVVTLVPPGEPLTPGDAAAFVAYDVIDAEGGPARVGIKQVSALPWTERLGSLQLELSRSKECGLDLVITGATGGRVRISIMHPEGGGREIIQYDTTETAFADIEVRAQWVGFVAKDATTLDRWDPSW